MKYDLLTKLSFQGVQFKGVRETDNGPEEYGMCLGNMLINLLLDAPVGENESGRDKLARFSLADAIDKKLTDCPTTEQPMEFTSSQVSLCCGLVAEHGNIRMVGAIAGIMGAGEFEK